MTVKVQAERAYNTATRLLPAQLAAHLDLCRPAFRACWGGPLNGQLRRREIVRDIARQIPFNRVLETGTYRGSTTEFFNSVFGVPVHTVEANPRNFEYSRRRLAVESQIDVRLGDSRTFLRELAQLSPHDTVFVYLDAHWEEDLPLREELELIAAGWAQCVVLVDDFEVPGDPGYAFDDYGAGKALTRSYLPDVVASWHLYYPTALSSTETGARRGSCVLSSPTLPLDSIYLSAAR